MKIRTVGREFLSDLHTLLTESLPYDRFSSTLIAEKLFDPLDGDTSHVWGAFENQKLIGLMQSIRRDHRGWLGLFAVAPSHRRLKVGTKLFQKACELWANVNEVEVLARPGNYFAPGLDPRYTEALSFLERHGFERFKDCTNLTVDLSTLPRAEPPPSTFALRPVRNSDTPALNAFFVRHFNADWRAEVEHARPNVHLALEGDEIVAFAAHSSQNREWGFFGPMGTAPDVQGKGLGRTLLLQCLHDLRDAGHKTAVIPWVGPIAFYARHCGARVDRIFWRYHLATKR